MRAVRYGIAVSGIILFLGACNNFFHDLIPPDDNRIIRFEIDGQIGEAQIGPDTIEVIVGKGTDLRTVIPRITVSKKASVLPMTLDYVYAAFPGVDLLQTAMKMYTTEDFTLYVSDLIRENPDFNVPVLTLPMDFTGPVTLAVISGQGSMRQYTVNVEIDTGEPRLLGFSFAKYDNPELMSDALGKIDETALTITATAMYPMEMDYLSYALIPSFKIMGDRLEIDGIAIDSGETEVQFDQLLGTQTKTITVWRDGARRDYALTVRFDEDPDTIRSITDFRFYKTDNTGIAASAVASIINTGDTGTITVQVFYSGARPSILIPGFITPGRASVGGVPQTSRANEHDFSSPLEYRVVSRNGLYVRTYTVRVSFMNLTSDAPRITSFRFNQNINPDLVQNTVAEISDGIIMINVYYGGTSAPDTLIPEFSAQGLVTVMGSVQISGSSAQFFNRQVKYTVTNPENPVLTRDYWVQTRMIQDMSSDAKIIAFGFYPEDNEGLDDPIIGRIDQAAGKISVFASVGSGVTTRTMYPRFEAVGRVTVGGTVQSSRSSPRVFDAPVTYTVTSANNKSSKNYTVEVREVKGTIFVNGNADGYNDGTSWQDAFVSLKDACEAAASFPDDIPKGIWIAAGTYTPGATAEDYFLLVANTSYIGGFAGDETAKSQRNVAENEVIISGNLGGGVYANNLFGSFSGNSALTVDDDVNFEDLTLENARAAINAVLSDGAELNISGCNFNGFTASGNGSAVYVNGGSAIITDSVIDGVQAANGAAVYSVNTSALTIDGLTLRNITGSGIYQINGGGVSLSGIDADGISGDAVYCSGISGGFVTIGGDSRFNNTGRVYVSSPVLVRVTDTEIANNLGNSALYVDSGISVTMIERVTIDRVPNGRGIYASSNNIVMITGSTIRNCTTTGDGGGIYNPGGGTLTVDGLTLRNITGSGIYKINGGGVSLSAIDADSISGDAVYCTGISNGFATLGGDSVFTNTGGVYIRASSSVQITDAEIRNNSGSSALDVDSGSGTVTITGVTIDGVPNGRGIAASSPISVIINESQIRNCTRTSGSGGGIYLAGAGNHEISDVVIENVAATNGGGIFDEASRSLSVLNTTIKNASATTSAGGLRRYSESGNLTVINSRFENCRATGVSGGTTGYRGAISAYSSSGRQEIIGTDFINCTSRNNYKILPASDFALIRNCTFIHDGALVDLGSPSVADSSVVSIFGYGGGNFDGCTFTNLRNNRTSRNFIFDAWGLRYSDAGSGSQYHYHELVLRDCTFNFNAGSAGLLAWGSSNDNYYILMDGCRITNPNNVGQRPLIWLDGNNAPNIFRFRANNYYNGTLLNSIATITANLVNSNVMLLSGNATPVLWP